MGLGDFLGLVGLIMSLFALFMAFWMTFGLIWAIGALIILLIPIAKAYYCWFYKADSPIGTCPSCNGTLFLHHREITLSFPPKVRIYGACPKCKKIMEIEKS